MFNARFKDYLLVLLVCLLSVFVSTSLFWRAEALNTQQQLVLAQQHYQQQQAAIANYESQLTLLNNQLNQAIAQANLRQSKITEMLRNEKNQHWSDQPVPDDVRRLFKQRSKSAQYQSALPTDKTMSTHQRRN